MNPIFPPFFTREYCSQHGDLASSFQTFEAGFKLIEDILQKKTLCCHDVTHLNQVYQAIEQLDNTDERTSSQNSSTLLQNLVQRVEAMKNRQTSAEEIITAYHLQQLKISSLNEVNISFCAPMNLTLEKMQEIAAHIPFCKSQEQFEMDTQALLGKSHSSDIAAILQAKKDQFCEYQKRLAVLKQLREHNSSLYPSYLEEILYGGFFHLYDHLIAMKALWTKGEQTAFIKKLSFSSFAKVILEFRKATLSKVDKIIPQDSSNIVFLLGNTGSGQSTTLCYLRGDKMIFQDGGYQSLGAEGNIIGNDTETSCTLFPNISVKDNLTIVDFPGFEGTHGKVISLAIELTLRSLTTKYSPKIILLTSITDTETRFANLYLLVKRLKRILGVLDNCILGLTKYSKDFDFVNIQAIEKQQQKELFSPCEEEKNLIQQIQTLEPFAGTVLAHQDQVNIFKEKLSQLQELKLLSSHEGLSDTEEKSRHYAHLFQKEEAFKKHSGINRIISFKDLTDQKQLQEIIKTLCLQERANPTLIPNTFDADDEKLLEILLTNNLNQAIKERQNLSAPFLISISKDISTDVEVFSQRILETSLINTLLEKPYPEIGEVLHLESRDPAIVRKYDKKLITDCIDGYIDEVISCFLLSEDFIQELKAKFPTIKTQEAEREWALLRSYILALSKGIPSNANPDAIKAARESLHKEYEKRCSEKEFKLSRGMEIILLTPLAIPYGIFSIFKAIKKAETSRDFMQDTIQKLYQNIKAAGQAVIALKDIENTIKKKDQFDEVFSSCPLSLTSVSSLRESLHNQITQIGKIYGKKEWDARVAFITAQLTSDLSSIRSNSPLGETLLYMLISQEVSCKNLPPYFNEHTFLSLIYSFLNSPLRSDLTNPTRKYQEILKWLFPSWSSTHYTDLNLSDPSYFFHISSVTDQEYLLLTKQRQKLLEPYNNSILSRLLFADVISRLWKKLPSPINDHKNPGFFNSIKDDHTKIFDAIRRNTWILEYSKEYLQRDKEFILSAVEMNGKVLAFAHDPFKNDREIVFIAIRQNGLALEYASEDLKNDREIVLTAIQKNSSALQFASEDLKNDREFILVAIKKTGFALQFVNENLKNDREVVLAAVHQDGRVLQFVNENLKNDREVVLVAVQENGFALKYASEDSKNDREVVLVAVQENGFALKYASEDSKNDREVVLAAVQENGYALKYVSEALKNDREVAFAAVQNNGWALTYASITLQRDPEIIQASDSYYQMRFPKK